MTFAAGLACEGLKPVVAIYSTFLQRAYDQLIHDVAIQNLPVVFALDRAGLVGADGATHAGAYDIAFLRCIPNMSVACPADEAECRQLLTPRYRAEPSGGGALSARRGRRRHAEADARRAAVRQGRDPPRRASASPSSRSAPCCTRRCRRPRRWMPRWSTCAGPSRWTPNCCCRSRARTRRWSRWKRAPSWAVLAARCSRRCRRRHAEAGAAARIARPFIEHGDPAKLLAGHRARCGRNRAIDHSPVRQPDGLPQGKPAPSVLVSAFYNRLSTQKVTTRPQAAFLFFQCTRSEFNGSSFPHQKRRHRRRPRCRRRAGRSCAGRHPLAPGVELSEVAGHHLRHRRNVRQVGERHVRAASSRSPCMPAAN